MKKSRSGQVVVLGMHRSGLSAISRTLELMGCCLEPADAFPSPDGSGTDLCSEGRNVRMLDESILASLGGSWCNVAPIVLPGPEDPLRLDFEEKARAIIARLDGHEPWAIEDPRLPLLFPLWRPVLSEPVCVLTYRSPLEIARSLQRQYGLSLPFGIALWELTSRRALESSAGLKRILVRYGDLVAAPVETAGRLEQSLRDAGISGTHPAPEAALLTFIEPGLHRERGDDELEDRLLTREQLELRDGLRDGTALEIDSVGSLSALAREELAAFSVSEESSRRATAVRSAGTPDWTGFAVCTIVAKNYLAMARVCCASFLRHHPGARAFVLLSDKLEGAIDTSREPFEILTAEELGIPDFQTFAFQYNVLEFSTALKPYVLRRLFETRDVSRLVYLDPDITVFGPMVELREALETSDIVLTPHVLSPLRDDGRRPSENDLLVAGVYNLGFIALRNSPPGLDLLHWWEARLKEGAFSDPARGLFTDQKWINLAPGHFPGVRILRHPGYNAAYWNIQERLQLEPDGDGWRIEGEPLRFFHFSGFQRKDLDAVSKYQDRFRLADLGRHYGALFTGYARALDAAGFDEMLRLRYAFGFFDNGARVPDFARRLYYDLGEKRSLFGNPFETGHEGSFFAWLMSPHRSGSVLSRLQVEILRLRGDVAAAFPDVEGVHATDFLQWVVRHSEEDMGLNAPYQERFREQLDSVAMTCQAKVARTESGRRNAQRCELERIEAEENRFHYTQASMVAAVAAAAATAVEDAARSAVSQALSPPEDGGEPRTELKRWLEALLGRERYRLMRRRFWDLRARVRGGQNPLIPAWTALEPPPLGPAFPAVSPVASSRSSVLPGPPASSPTLVDSRASVFPSSPSNHRPFGVNLFGYFDTESGVGEVGRGLAAMLEESGLPHALVNVEQQWLRRECRTAFRYSEEHPYAVNLLAVNADQAPHVVRQFGLSRSPDQYFIGYWFWELSLFPERLAGSFSLFDEVWAATDFCLDTFSRAGTVPVVKIPPALEPVPLGQNDRARFGFVETDFVFLYVFDSASVLARKNPAGAISAFRAAFGPEDPVRLVLKTTNASSRKVQALQRIAGPSRIEVWNGYFDRGKLLDLVAAVDAYVSLHRSEGLGLTLLEAMMLGKPVVATDYSGVRDFLQGPLAFPVGYEVLRLRRDHGPYVKGGVWAEPDRTAAARQMRNVLDTRRTVPAWPQIAERAARAARDRYSVAATAPVLRERLALIRKTLEGRRAT